jgi:hypothetical protein
MAFSKLGNKIHIYSLEDFQLKYCLFLCSHELKVTNACFNFKSKLFATLSYDGTDLNLNLFNLKILSSEDHLCQCDDHDDGNIKKIHETIAEANTGITSYFGIGSLVSKITVKIIIF